MAEQRIIILQSVKHPQLMFGFSSLKKVCDAFEYFSYSYIKQLKFPFTYKGWIFLRIKFNPDTKFIQMPPLTDETIEAIHKMFREDNK